MPATLTPAFEADLCAALGIPRFDRVTAHEREKKTVADATDPFELSSGRQNWILIISNEVSPLLVKRAVDFQRTIRSRLRDSAEDVIELPVAEGFYGERSYALWPMRRQISSSRIYQRLQRIRLVPRVFGWLRDVAAQSGQAANREALADNLTRLASVEALPSAIREAAEQARASVLAGAIPPIQQVLHGDLWLGNVLLAPNKRGFVIIDWAGGKTDGVPFFDLTKFALSVRISPAALRREIETHASILRCDPKHSSPYVLAGLGKLHEELEHFPEQRFIELCRAKFDALSAALR